MLRAVRVNSQGTVSLESVRSRSDNGDMSNSLPVPAETPKPARRRWRPGYVVLYVVYLLLLAFGGLELFWRLRVGSSVVEPAGPEAIWSLYYREMDQEKVLELEPSLTDEQFDVLLLGGSVAEQVKGALQAEFEKRLDQPVHICNLARSGHSSRDSLIKYRRIQGKPFDCVLVYNGINDVPLNYVAASDFRDDYTHCGWYLTFNRRLESGQLVITDLKDDLAIIGSSRPTPAFFKYGTQVKTNRAVAQNLRQIVELAQAAGSQTLLMTFAWHLPDDYTQKRFEAGELDYGEGEFSIEVEFWGRAEHLPGIMEAQNESIRRLARETGTGLVDQAKLIKEGRYFSDVCHLTPLGCRFFAENVAASLFDREIEDNAN